ncbi:hypothetical protein CA3LBN_003274 [Candidozyma haemuli]|uniref:Uncharacterized protein n=1 Tax=Candidozyma haemuli TaxID=45357 RepID=A0ABX8I6P5_9ASCO|nr:hypothetical protein CA3LBN_003274 [[Candida] haemuloni]
MTDCTLHFIERQKSYESLSSAIATLKDSDYISYDTHTFVIDNETWTASSLQVQNFKILSRKEYPLNDVKKSEGVSKFGSWPKLDDGQGRIVYSFMYLHQLSMISSHWLDSWDEGALICVRLLQVGQFKMPLDVSFSYEGRDNSKEELESQDDYIELKNASEFGNELEERHKNSINLQAVASYIPPDEYNLLSSCNIVRSGSSINDFLSLQIRQESASLCSCDSDVSIKHVNVTLVEHLQFKPNISVNGIAEETRSLLLKDSDSDFDCSPQLFTKSADGFVCLPEASLYDCDLPNLGPTFHSDTCSRTYRLEFDLQAECRGEKPCSANISTSLDIEIGSEVDSSEKTAKAKVYKAQDLVFVDSLPRTENLVPNISDYVSEKLSNVEHCLGHQTCVSCQKYIVTAVTTIYSSSSLSYATYDEEEDEDDLTKRVDDLDLVASNGLWKLRNKTRYASGKVDHQLSLPLSKCFHIIEGFESTHIKEWPKQFTSKVLHEDDLFLSPGMCIGSSVKFIIEGPYTTDTVYGFYRWKVELFQRTLRMTPKDWTIETNVIEIPDPQQNYTLTHKPNDVGVFDFRNDVNLCKIPSDLEPSLHSNALHREYQLKFSIEIETEEEDSPRVMVSHAINVYIGEIDSFHIKR